jgi:hypothetical protein
MKISDYVKLIGNNEGIQRGIHFEGLNTEWRILWYSVILYISIM